MADDNKKYELKIDGTSYFFLTEVKKGDNKITLERVDFEKGIYQPAEMHATFNISGSPKYNDLVDAFAQKKVALTIDGNKVAENYFVFKVKPLFKTVANNTSTKLELTICSEDKLMTLDKYSKAYSGRKLGAIYKDEVGKFKLGSSAISTNAGSVGSDLQLVSYGTGEFIQPYLVQYNESFYDFLKRTANRCGEFLYHEGGKLHLGLSTTDKTSEDLAPKARERYYENILRENVEVDDYAYNYLSDTTAPGGGNQYSDPQATDDYLSDIPKDYTSQRAQVGMIEKNALTFVCQALTGQTLSGIVANFAVGVAFKELTATVVSANLNFCNEAINITPWQGKTEQWGTGDAGSVLRQFGTAADQKSKISTSNTNLYAKFYSLVRKAEKEVSENAVFLEFGNKTQDLSIGDLIKVDGNVYLVVKVSGGCEYVFDDGAMSLAERQQVVGVQLYSVGNNKVPIPPTLPEVTIRESQPQLAFITDTMDPKKIGRVRLRFSWQQEGDDASPWVRVSLPFATDGGGVKFRPETGDEVIVSFEEGNVERPYVSGYLLSPRSNKEWLSLPDRTITSKNGHNITFNDGLDGGSFFYGLYPGLEAVRAFIPTSWWPNAFDDNGKCLAMSGGMTISDRYGLYKIEMSSDSRSVLIQSAMGNVTVNAFTGITIAAPNGNIDIVGKNISLKASNTVSIESGAALKNRFTTDSADEYKEGNNTWKGLSWAGRLVADTMVNLATAAVGRTVDKLLDMSLLRTVAEIALRPIDGTTRIKSFTFIQMEAGKGSVEYPANARKETLVLPDTMQAIKAAAASMGTRVDSVKKAFERVCGNIAAWNTLAAANNIHAGEPCINLADIVSASWNNRPGTLNYNWQAGGLAEGQGNDQIDQDMQKAINDLKQTLNIQDAPKLEDEKYNKEGMTQEQGEKLFNDDLKKWNDGKAAIEKEANDKKQAEQAKKEKRQKITLAAVSLFKSVFALYKAAKKDFMVQHVAHPGVYQDYVLDALNAVKTDCPQLKPIWDGDIKATTTTASIEDWESAKSHLRRKAVFQLLTNAQFQSDVNDAAGGQFKLTSGNDVGNNDLSVPANWASFVDNIVSTKEDPAPGNYLADTANKRFKKWWEQTYEDPWLDATVNRKRFKTGAQGKILFSDVPGKTISFDKTGAANATYNVVATDKYAVELYKQIKNI